MCCVDGARVSSLAVTLCAMLVPVTPSAPRGVSMLCFACLQLPGRSHDGGENLWAFPSRTLYGLHVQHRRWPDDVRLCLLDAVVRARMFRRCTVDWDRRFTTQQETIVALRVFSIFKVVVHAKFSHEQRVCRVPSCCNCRAGHSMEVISCGRFRLAHCISHGCSVDNGPMTLIYIYFQGVLHFDLASCAAKCDRGCATLQRNKVGIMWCITLAAIGTSETNASGSNHVHEKAPVISGVFGHLSQVIVIGDVTADMCDRYAQVSWMCSSLLHCASR